MGKIAEQEFLLAYPADIVNDILPVIFECDRGTIHL
jgi:hypothetical protein